jgi:hypothetical protein
MTGQSKVVAFLYSLRSALWPKQSEAVRGGYPYIRGRRSERDPNPIHRGLYLGTRPSSVIQLVPATPTLPTEGRRW